MAHNKPKDKKHSASKSAASAGSPSAGSQGSEKSNASQVKPSQGDSLRETVESVVVAFVLAFLFRAFEAEAFVIPTGSMAPTLYGRHKELDCEECGVRFAVGASDELDKQTGRFVPRNKVTSAFCPNCRFENRLDSTAPFKGDRILVNKFPYEVGSPRRWDVPVFKYPDEPQTNYIKRLVGLPGEELQITRGDVYARKEETEPFVILRKEDPNKQRMLQQLVSSHDNVARTLIENGWPESWQGVKQRAAGTAGWVNAPNNWHADTELRSFEIDNSEKPDDQRHWLRYRHFVPNEDVWNRVLTGEKIDTQAIQPQLVTDYCSYNAYTGGDPLHIGPLNDDVYWVGDLTFDCQVQVQSKSGELLLELVEGVRRYHCSFDLETGQATLSFLDDSLNPGEAEPTDLATVKTSVKGPGTYDLCFANVDSRLCLWVDDDLIDLGTTGDYAAAMFPGPQRRDLSPVGIAVQNAHVKVSHLTIRRDVYYRAESIPEDGFSRDEEFGRSTHYLAELLHDPEEWSKEYESNHQIATFSKLADDEYFMLGDNSPRSQDSRLWPNNRGRARRHAVPRTALVGKAFFVYWPHGVPFLNGGKGFPISYHRTPAGKKTDYPAFSIPFRPNFERMHRIR